MYLSDITPADQQRIALQQAGLIPGQPAPPLTPSPGIAIANPQQLDPNQPVFVPTIVPGPMAPSPGIKPMASPVPLQPVGRSFVPIVTGTPGYDTNPILIASSGDDSDTVMVPTIVPDNGPVTLPSGIQLPQPSPVPASQPGLPPDWYPQYQLDPEQLPASLRPLLQPQAGPVSATPATVVQAGMFGLNPTVVLLGALAAGAWWVFSPKKKRGSRVRRRS